MRESLRITQHISCLRAPGLCRVSRGTLARRVQSRVLEQDDVDEARGRGTHTSLNIIEAVCVAAVPRVCIRYFLLV